MRIDLHVHSTYSNDSLITPQVLQYYVRKCGLDAVAITDHDQFDGAREVFKNVGFPVVPGIEVSSSQGHVVGLAVNKPIPPRLSIEETVEKIHDAGGLAIACHPGGLFKRSVDENSEARFDAVEVINSSAFPYNRCIVTGERLANRLNISRVGGSDAHYGPEIGYGYTVLDATPDVSEIIQAIKDGRCRAEGRSIPLSLRVKRKLLTTLRK